MKNNTKYPNKGFYKTPLQETHGDEYYTKQQDVITIAENLRHDIGKIWLPFDSEQSYFYKILPQYGFDVVATTSDFFTTFPPEGVQCIVSNPPFSVKRAVVDRCVGLGIPFALLLPCPFVCDGYPLQFANQLILWRYRRKFNNQYGVDNQPVCNCCVASDGLLKQDLTISFDKYTKQ